MRWSTIGLFVLLGCNVAAPVEDGTGGAPSSGSSNADATSSSAAGGGSASSSSSGGGTVTPDGSWTAPFLIEALPTTVTGDTRSSTIREASAYWPCAANTNEGGAEIVYRVTVDTEGYLSARVDDVPGDDVDVDVHLLHGPDPDRCVTRADVQLGAPVAPGDYWLVVDSWVDGAQTALEGAFTLTVGLVASAGDMCLLSPIVCDGMVPPFVNEVPVEEAGAPGCLPGMARIDDFCIDRYEAMMVEVLPNNELAPLSPYDNPGLADTMALSVAGVVPQGFVTQAQATEACQRAGKRLCFDDEWRRACSASNTYPYGDARQPGVCNDARDCHPVVQFFESGESWVWSELAHPCISQLPEGLDRTGANTGCTESGVFDMMGNLHEWTADPTGTFRGGFYVDTVINGPGCDYATTAHNTQHWDYSTGFRCCAEAL